MNEDIKKDSPEYIRLGMRIYCSHPFLLRIADPGGSIAPRFRLFSVQECEELDGDIFIDDQVRTDSDNNITTYDLWIRYTPEADGSGFKVEELDKLRKLIGRSLIGDI